jgi:hypothetical protein
MEAELIELVRVEITGMRTDVQTALTQTAEVLSTRVRSELEQRMGEPSALAHGIHGIQETITTRDADLANMLRQVSATCDALAERVEADRIERTALVDAVSRLTTALADADTLLPPTSPERATVIGGTVDPMQASPVDVIETVTDLVEAGPPDEIDLVAAARVHEPWSADTPRTRSSPPPAGLPVRPDGVEVRCRFGDRWVTGFEVCEVIRTDNRTRYRLRRRSDGSVIPTLFEEKDLRFFSTTFVDRP